ncbi:hypothetical protein [Ureibacillus sinduriensis]|uniref:Uncharacterized protein n=1 Tax=Ureibacillus sinduriensis BLB-1 = JCM 15800 TaxID=1384057 RepID=A0A0A3IHF3_9BACL|nr:hypothetical protein [Ureibacillus sinduriensis]KGR74252.1 hypothetical protein CD33_19940 [Ureibacillus sinduriensis BLB-1 = JCM 15800]
MTNNQENGEFNTKSKSPIDVSNEEVRFSKDEEFGLITVEHPGKNNSKKLSMKDVIKNMDNNQGGMA